MCPSTRLPNNIILNSFNKYARACLTLFLNAAHEAEERDDTVYKSHALLQGFQYNVRLKSPAGSSPSGKALTKSRG